MNECLILYATQSGRAKACARRTARILREKNVWLCNGSGSSFEDDSILEFAKQSTEIKANRFLLLFVSTTGDGEHVDAMRKTWKQLIQISLPKDLFREVKFALFCLGDRAYGDQFCAAGRKLAARLLQLGATLLCEPGYGDDCTPNGGVFCDLDDWIENCLTSDISASNSLMQTHDISTDANTSLASYRISLAEPQSSALDQSPKEEWQQYQYIRCYQSYFSHLRPLTAYRYEAGAGAAAANNCCDLSDAPMLANVLVNDRITSPNWNQNTRHIELQVSSQVSSSALANFDTMPRTKRSQLPYRAGDVAVVLPSNTPDSVRRLLKALPERIQKMADKILLVENINFSAVKGATISSACTFWPGQCTLRGWLAYCADIHALPEREDLRALASYCSLDHEHGMEQANKLISLSETAGAALYADYVLREKRSWPDVLHDFDSIRAAGSKLTVEGLFGLIGPIRPREFSIASSPLEVCEILTDSSDEETTQWIVRLHLCVAVVEGRTPLGRHYQGLCSSYLSQLQTNLSQVQIWIRPGSFTELPLAMPSNNAVRFEVPVLFIGAGTGIAPLRGLIREREATRHAMLKSSGRDGAESQHSRRLRAMERDNILIFGCRREQDDFYYHNEWAAFCMEGRLTLSTAFSRDQVQKVYVQQLLKNADDETSIVVNHLLARNGAVYIAGSPRMARAVKDVIVISLAQALGSEQRAKQLLSNLQRAGYFSIEAWS
ncbi:hypothetical protein MPSEU_000652700 [Mayamaea pseudoterrestris]|nr:hypothetical protein MPSEU_000652700 [Mayamaea pseudoterrestris]